MKKTILSLLLGFIGLISFSSANDFIKQYSYAQGSATSFSCTENCECRTNYSNSPGQGDFEVFIVDNKGLSIKGIRYNCDTPGKATYSFNGSNNFNFNIPVNHGYCRFTVIFDGQISSMSDCPDVIITSSSSCPECQECETCPEIDTGAILSGYIAIEDVTTNYCTSNDLCPEISGGNSAIYINDIRHESMPFINLRIPEEIERNYEYTGNNTQLDINVEGYGYDQEKMQNMINTQYYTPTSEEMSSLIGKIADFLPLIAIALLIIRIRRVLKKVFRF